MITAAALNRVDAFVVILNWNRAADTLECLQSLAIQQDVCLHTIVVDNGSSDDSLARIAAAFPAVELIANPVNLGFPGGMNTGIQRALQLGPQPILLLNNDTLADARMLRNLLDGLTPGVGCAAPAIYYAGAPQRLWSSGGNIHPVLLEMMNQHPQAHDQPVQKTFFTGCALLVRREVFDQVGLFDERFFPGYYEDLDFSLRILRAGIKMVLLPKARLWHKISQSSGGSNSPRVRFLMARNSARYFRKHMRAWQAPFIIVFRLLSALKTSALLLLKQDGAGLKAHWIGLLSGWLGWRLAGLRAYTGQYQKNSLKSS